MVGEGNLFGKRVKFTAQEKINKLERYIRRKVPAESITDIHSYSMSYLNYIIRSYMGNMAPIEKTEMAADDLLKDKDIIVNYIKEYGRKKLPVIYTKYKNILEVKNLMNSSIGELMQRLNKMYSSETIRLSQQFYTTSKNELHFSVMIMDRFGMEYEPCAIMIIMHIIAIELDKVISKDILYKASRIVADNLGDNEINRLFKELYTDKIDNSFKLMERVGESVLFIVFNYNFKDKSHWPYQNDVLDLIYSKVQQFEFSEKTALKMKLLNCTEYKEISIESALHILVLKKAIEIVYNKDLNNTGG